MLLTIDCWFFRVFSKFQRRSVCNWNIKESSSRTFLCFVTSKALFILQIRVNAVNPTVVMTDMGRLGWSDPAKAKPMLDQIPLGRFAGKILMPLRNWGRPLTVDLFWIYYDNTSYFPFSAEVEEVVHAIVYLLSDKASMITGTILPVDGGFLAC